MRFTCKIQVRSLYLQTFFIQLLSTNGDLGRLMFCMKIDEIKRSILVVIIWHFMVKFFI